MKRMNRDKKAGRSVWTGGRRNLWLRMACVLIVAVITAQSTSAEELSAGQQEDETMEQTEKTPIRLVLRPVKTVGEADPDLLEEILEQICQQITEKIPAEGPETVCTEPSDDSGDPDEEAEGAGAEADVSDPDTETGGTGPDEEDPDLRQRAEKLGSCVTWAYRYDEDVPPPGEKRPPGESEIMLFYAEDPDYAFLPAETEEHRSFLTTLAAGGDEDEKPEEENTEDKAGAEDPEEDTADETGSGEPGETASDEAGAENSGEAASDEAGADGPAEAAVDDTGADGPAEAAADEGGTGRPEEEGQADSTKENGTEKTGTAEADHETRQSEDVRIPAVLPAADRPAEAELPAQHILTAVRTEPEEKRQEKEEKPRIILLRTGKNGMEDLTEEYREILNTAAPESVNWTEVLSGAPENDGIYTLRETYRDAEGRDRTRETSFSVNRYGSVYLYGAQIRNLQRKTVRRVEKALVISEYNPDRLLKDSWNVEISRDGEPLSRVVYRVEEKDNSSSGYKPLWHRYDYEISPENFRQDGVYRIILTSRDAAGNAPESHAYNGGEILFAVDSAPPELLTIRGMEKSVFSGEAEHTVTGEVFDAMGLARIDVFLDGTLLRSFTEFTDRNRAQFTFEVGEASRPQKIRICAVDEAGNVLDTEETDEQGRYLFRPGYPYERSLLVTADVSEPDHPLKKAGTLLLSGTVCAAAAALFLYLRIYRRRIDG